MTDVATTPAPTESTSHLTSKPSFLERKLGKPRPDIVPTLPFHSAALGTFSDATTTTLMLPLTVSLAELSNKANLMELVRRLVLFRNPDAIQGFSQKRVREESSDEDDDAETKARRSVPAPSRAVVCINKVGTPQSHAQAKKGGASGVRFLLPVEVVVATINHGICPGVVCEIDPFPGAVNVQVQCGDERIKVTCVMPDAEVCVNDQTVLVAAEPSCLRVQIFRPPRVSRGKFQKTLDVKLGKTEITFIPDFDGDAKVRKAAEAKRAAEAEAAATPQQAEAEAAAESE